MNDEDYFHSHWKGGKAVWVCVMRAGSHTGSFTCGLGLGPVSVCPTEIEEEQEEEKRRLQEALATF